MISLARAILLWFYDVTGPEDKTKNKCREIENLPLHDEGNTIH